VFAFARERGLPVAVAMGGGYCPEVERVVEIHFATVREALAHAGAGLGRAGPPPSAAPRPAP
jgi:hypothetical protein